MSKIRQRTKHLIYAGLCGAGVIGLCFAGYVIYSSIQFKHNQNELRARYEQQIRTLEEGTERVTVFVPAQEVTAGKEITKKDLVGIYLPKQSLPDHLLPTVNELVGKTTKINLTRNMPITTSMIYEEQPTTDDMRNRELNTILMPTDIKKGDTVDIRIQFPTGQDYIVLTKKKLNNLDYPTIWTTLKEDEMLALSSATVDALLHKASLYAVSYVEPQLQKEAIPTYPSNAEVLNLMKADPNIVGTAERYLLDNVRKQLELDLKALSDEQRLNIAQSAQSAAESAISTRQSYNQSSGISSNTSNPNNNTSNNEQSSTDTSNSTNSESTIYKNNASEAFTSQ
ncbi:SAF domain-containing protein [Paenibacillus kyungheensis]